MQQGRCIETVPGRLQARIGARDALGHRGALAPGDTPAGGGGAEGVPRMSDAALERGEVHREHLLPSEHGLQSTHL